MDNTLQVIALIIIALILLAVIIRYRREIAVTLEIFGIKLNVQAKDQPQPTSSRKAPSDSGANAGVEVEGLATKKGDIVLEGGESQSGPGLKAKNLKSEEGDILIGKGVSGDPKANPPA